MIIKAFVRWAETAKAGDRARAANALGRAWLQPDMMDQAEHDAALTAMTWLLDDASPKVRLAPAEALADSERAPRSLILPLAEDQPEIACQIIARSPVLRDPDLVDLAARGDQVTRVLIASRMIVGYAVAAAIVEVGESLEVQALLDNPGAVIGKGTLCRIAARFSGDIEIRRRLDEREELPAEARHVLTVHVSDALLNSPLVRAALAPGRLRDLGRDACESATLTLIENARSADYPALIAHLLDDGRLTPGLLMQAICTRKHAFFAAVVSTLSGHSERRVTSVLADGRAVALRVLIEQTGLGRGLAPVFVAAILLSRKFEQSPELFAGRSIASRLLETFDAASAEGDDLGSILEMLGRLEITERRRSARAYASVMAIEAA